MATPLRMPDLGTVEGDVILVRWLKKEGDAVALGEPLFEVETDKGISEVESAMAGDLVKLMVQEGAKAGAGEVIALIRRPGEEAGEAPGQAAPTPRAAAQGAAPAARGAAGPKVAPAVRALAEKHGVDISTVAATGPGGMVTRQDVLLARGAAGARPPAGAPSAPAASTRPATYTRHQAGIARLVAHSHREKAIFHVQVSVDMTRAVALRGKSKESGSPVRYDALIVKAAAAAITDYPALRTWMKGEEAVEHPEVSIAFAVAVGDELYVPAVKAADGKAAGEISREMDGLARKAAEHGLSAQDSEGSCFLVSNLGMFPVSSFDAVIFPEHSAALAVGAIIPTPVAEAGAVRVAPLAVMTLSVDHRLINGKQAAQFLARVKEILETGAFE
jgi:pyruvate/2-oxoglutarate dehydrogenase complex dihydrolipoamide acyltransferase (E2) component